MLSSIVFFAIQEMLDTKNGGRMESMSIKSGPLLVTEPLPTMSKYKRMTMTLFRNKTAI